jgi:hypothetical protein
MEIGTNFFGVFSFSKKKNQKIKSAKREPNRDEEKKSAEGV